MADLGLRATQAELRAKESRCEVNASSDHVKAKISSAEQMKVHPARAGLVIGDRDMEANAVSVRVRGQGNLGAKPRDEVLADIIQSIKDRRV
ncbi:MAG: His/Gly/Thr/Pro-type tRNA ligase C-terminal domain-containing protein [Verrucomicrobiota bacterium]|nr:His/Gly/Thr/Pro-type tRNA ligase C-terminal domain-containing protein [Verrucomicrobiota bacterium]